MANEEIIAVFRADIEQFRAQMLDMKRSIEPVDKAVNDLVDRFGVPFKKATDATDKFGKSTKSASGSISTLSRGLQGITGLLGVTGRLFGVNTDKIQELVFAGQQFARVGQDIVRAQKLATAATEASTKAVVAQTAAEKVLNAVRSAGAFGIGLVVTGLTVLIASVYSYITAAKEQKAIDETQAELDKKAISNKIELAKANKGLAQSANDLAIKEALRTGLVDESGARRAALEQQLDVDIKAIRLKSDADLLAIALGSFKSEFARGNARLAAIKQREELEKAATKQFFIDVGNIKSDAAKKEDDETKQKNAEAIAENKKFFNDLSKSTKAGLKKTAAEEEKEIESLLKKGDEAITKIIDEGEADRNGRLREWLKDRIAALKEAKSEEERSEQEAKDALEKARLERLEQEKMALDTIFSIQQEAFDKRQELLDEEIDNQKTAIDVQRSLAERGLNNTLAFEEKRAADLRRQQQKEAEQQKKIKLLETFLNSLAEFSKTDPKTALQKALLQVALATAASAVFAEEGGIIGEIGHTSNLRRRHRGGGDVLLHAQTGEGILSRREMDNLGKRNFHLLKDAARFPIREDVFAMPKMLAMNGGSQVSNAEVVKELKALQHIVKNKKETHYDLKQNGEYYTTVIENGFKTVTKGKLRKPRLP